MSAVTTKLQFRSRSIIQYNRFERTGGFSRSFQQQQSAEELKKQETYTGKLCPGAKKRLTKAIETLAQLAENKTYHFVSKRTNQPRTIKYNLTFATLTLYSTERDLKGKEVHKTCLEPFLLWLHRHCGCNLYIWKAELQERGQLHYHITSDTFIDNRLLRDKWNQLQKEAGYLNAFYAKYGHWNANSTDIHSVYKELDIAGYIKKKIIKEYGIRNEITKDIQNQATVGGKVWDCSLPLKSAKFFETEGTTGTEKYLNYAIKNGDAEKISTDHCNIITFKRKRASCILSQFDRILYKEHLAGIKRYERKPPRAKVKFDNGDFEAWLELEESRKPLPEVQDIAKEKIKKVNFKVEPDLFKYKWGSN